MAKKYVVKVYSKTGTYLNTWDEVISDVTFQNEINTAGGSMNVILARKAGDYGEGSDIDFGYKVTVLVIDKELPNGTIIFQGYISAYTPIYKNDTVSVTLLSYGSQLNDYLIEAGEAADISLTLDTATEYSIGNTNGSGLSIQAAQTYSNTDAITLSTIEVYAATQDKYDSSTGLFSEQFNQLLYIDVYTGTTPPSGTLLGTLSVLIADKTFRYYKATTTETITLSAATSYHLRFRSENQSPSSNYAMILLQAATAYASGNRWSLDNSGGPVAWSSTSGDIYFKQYSKTFVTSAGYLSMDPSLIIKKLIDEASVSGSNITYTSTSIDDTLTTVSYTFNTNTIYEGVSKAVELAPVDWYWYIDYSNNSIQFHKKKEIATHTFSLEKDIIDARFEKRIEDIINTIYFVGGIVGITNLFQKYTSSDSISKYGIKSIKYVDGRVTTSATADIIANAILQGRSEPELRVTLEILDSNNEQGLGYDIESIQVGDTIAVRNITSQAGLSTWDFGRYDESYWDYNIHNLSSLNMQVQRIEYNQNSAKIYASTIATDINKRIEDINRNLEQTQATDNPTSPS